MLSKEVLLPLTAQIVSCLSSTTCGLMGKIGSTVIILDHLNLEGPTYLLKLYVLVNCSLASSRRVFIALDYLSKTFPEVSATRCLDPPCLSRSFHLFQLRKPISHVDSGNRLSFFIHSTFWPGGKATYQVIHLTPKPIQSLIQSDIRKPILTGISCKSAVCLA